MRWKEKGFVLDTSSSAAAAAAAAAADAAVAAEPEFLPIVCVKQQLMSNSRRC
jgi:hypothetical protein